MCQILLNCQIRQRDTPWIEAAPDKREKIDPRLYRIFSFGHLPALIDWLWIQCLIDPSVSAVETGAHPQMYYDLDLLSDLDPEFQEVYIAGASLLAVIRRDGIGARDLLKKGNLFFKQNLGLYPEKFKQQFWSNSWQIPVLLGYVHLFELDDMSSASVFFQEAAEIPGAPLYLLSLKKRLERVGGEYEVGLRLLNLMIAGSQDEQVRKNLETKKLNLYVGQYIFNLNHNFLNYLKTQPTYKARPSFTPQEMEIYWKEFIRTTQTPTLDPWGGVVHLDEMGKVVSTTPHEAVFHLQ